MLERTQPGEVTLLLWQNHNTVVIGRNQNVWRECRVGRLEQDGGFLARRRSGGGAVYHDLGNLNFSFIARDADYNPARQFEVIIDAMGNLGIAATMCGRNDLLVDGRKFSGNAFLHTGGRNCHHGTILIDTDKLKMERYLNVSPDKLNYNGVPSIKARVANLCEFLPALTVDKVRRALVDSFAGIYGGVPQKFDLTELPSSRFAVSRERFASRDWCFGKSIPFTRTLIHRFDWGEIELHLQVTEGRVQSANAFSDALTIEPIEVLPNVIEGIPFSSEPMLNALSQIPQPNGQTRRIVADIRSLILSDLNKYITNGAAAL